MIYDSHLVKIKHLKLGCQETISRPDQRSDIVLELNPVLKNKA